LAIWYSVTPNCYISESWNGS